MHALSLYHSAGIHNYNVNNALAGFLCARTNKAKDIFKFATAVYFHLRNNTNMFCFSLHKHFTCAGLCHAYYLGIQQEWSILLHVRGTYNKLKFFGSWNTSKTANSDGAALWKFLQFEKLEYIYTLYRLLVLPGPDGNVLTGL